MSVVLELLSSQVAQVFFVVQVLYIACRVTHIDFLMNYQYPSTLLSTIVARFCDPVSFGFVYKNPARKIML